MDKIQESMESWEVHNEVAVSSATVITYLGITTLMQAYRTWGTKARRACTEKGYTRWQFEACRAEHKLKALKKIRKKVAATRKKCTNYKDKQTCNAVLDRQLKDLDAKIKKKGMKLDYYLKRVRREK